MTTADGTIHGARDRHLRLAREGTFGSAPAEPNWLCLPVPPGGWTVSGDREWSTPDTNMGGAATEVAVPGLLSARGKLSVPPYPEAAGFLLDAALERPAPDRLHSYCADHVTPVESRRYLGLTVRALTLSATADRVRVGLRFRGRDEVSETGVAESDFDYSNLTAVPFSLRGAHLEINDTDLGAVSGFTLRVDNDLRPGPNEGDRTAYMLAGRRTVTLRLDGLHGGDAVSRAARQGQSVSFSADFTHPAGHYMGLRLPRLLARRSDERAGSNGMARRTARLVAAEDPARGYDIDYGVDLAPGGTTMMPDITG